MAIKVFFQYKNQVMTLPVNPESLEVVKGGKNKTVDIVKLGQVNTLRGVGLANIGLDGFLPANANAPYVLTKNNFKKPQAYIDFFETVRKDRQPLRLVVSDTDINMLVSIEDFNHKYEASDDAIYFALKLKEYRQYSSKRVTIKKPTNHPKPVAKPKPKPRPKKDFAVGNKVKVSGKWWATSYRGGPFGYAPSGFVGVIGIKVSKNRPCPYHIETLDGRWRGWVSEAQVKHV